MNREEVQVFARELGRTLAPASVVAFFGELGVGKTTCVKEIVASLTNIEAFSPTFTYLNIYEHLYHFDLFRLRSSEEFVRMGFDEYFTAGGICLIEWAERIEEILPPGTVKVRLTHAGEDKRLVEVT